MKNRIRILATSDVHGTIYPYRYSDGHLMDYGLSKLNTLIQSLRDENTLLLDNGDTLEGSPLSFFHYQVEPDEVAPITKVMNEMEYDYVNVGNHDFNYGEAQLFKHLNALHAPCITANVIYNDAPLGATYVIREIAGKKLALFGITTTCTKDQEKKENIEHFIFEDAFEVAKRTVSHLKLMEKPDYIICLYHGGFERDLLEGYQTEPFTGENEGYRILQELPGIDVLITGHQHKSLCGELFSTVYTQTASKGAELACIDIYTDTNVIEPVVLKVDVESDLEIEDLIQDTEKKCQTWLDQPLGSTAIDLTIQNEMEARLHKSQVVTFLNRVQQAHTGAMLSATALFHGATGFNKTITMRDLVSTYVFPNTLTVKEINGKLLREYLEKCAAYWSIHNNHICVSPSFESPVPLHFNYDMVDGIDYTIKVSNQIGKRIVELKYLGNDVQDSDRFTIAVNSYRASGGGNFEMMRNCPTVKEYPTDIVELIADYILECKTIDFEAVNNITVIQ
ncbi:MAG: bifunctional metallophosphatase/5'-nucleotidase [Solobacterium sp.]|nr:bifunctional metallophosphatase/5'-nucleotidase [Solobacterium sp.]